MAKQDDYVRYTIRVPADLYARLQEMAGAKSVNAEIVARLEESFAENAAHGEAGWWYGHVTQELHHLADKLRDAAYRPPNQFLVQTAFTAILQAFPDATDVQVEFILESLAPWLLSEPNEFADNPGGEKRPFLVVKTTDEITREVASLLRSLDRGVPQE